MAKEEKKKTSEEAKPKVQGMIVRLAGRDINGDKRIYEAIGEIKGIGHTMAHALSIHIRDALGIDYNQQIGHLDEANMSKIEHAVKDATDSKIPSYLFNRRMEMQSGKNMHLVGTDLIVKVKQDIDSDIKLMSWRGIRHKTGQKVRGQKTRSTGRTGATIGVMKKAAKQVAAKAAEAKK
jgi:small subunit ribosomal protein S13